jgi:hypothetical protein
MLTNQLSLKPLGVFANNQVINLNEMLDSKEMIDSDEKIKFFSTNVPVVDGEVEAAPGQRQAQESETGGLNDSGKKILGDAGSNSSSTGSMDYAKSAGNQSSEKGSDQKIDESLEVI